MHVAALCSVVAALLASQISLDRSKVDDLERQIAGATVVGFESLDQPVHRVVIVKFPDAVCEIRFLAYTDASSGGKTNRFSDYEVRSVPMAPTDALEARVEQGRVVDRGMAGLGHWGWRRGKHTIQCGRRSLRWLYPTGIRLPPEALVAPTGWTDFTQVRHGLGQLKWYALDSTQQRPLLKIPIDELPRD